MSIITTDEGADAAECATTRVRGAELIVRERNGIAVTLFWLRATDVLLVAVAGRNGTSFELVLQRDDRALDVSIIRMRTRPPEASTSAGPPCEPGMEFIDA
jgi:hypothetical protein